jgi:hypothetical protein
LLNVLLQLANKLVLKKKVIMQMKLLEASKYSKTKFYYGLTNSVFMTQVIQNECRTYVFHNVSGIICIVSSYEICSVRIRTWWSILSNLFPVHDVTDQRFAVLFCVQILHLNPGAAISHPE